MSVMTIAEGAHAASRDFARQPLGKVGMWWFLASEIMVFGGLIGSYILSRIAAGDKPRPSSSSCPMPSSAP